MKRMTEENKKRLALIILTIEENGGRTFKQCGEKFGFTSYIAETRASFSSYIDSSIYHSKVVPGEGFANVFKTKSYDFPVAQGNLFYKPFNFLEINFGHGKNIS